jgi:hypothetical protein
MKTTELTAVEWFAMITEAFGYVSKIQLKEALRMEESQREQDFINGYKARAELSGLIFDEASELTAKELFKQQEQ